MSIWDILANNQAYTSYIPSQTRTGGGQQYTVNPSAITQNPGSSTVNPGGIVSSVKDMAIDIVKKGIFGSSSGDGSGDGGSGWGYGYGYGGYSGPTQQQKDAAAQTKALYKEGANTTYNAALDNFKTLNEQWGINDSMAKSQWRTADVAADRDMLNQEKKQQSMTSKALNSMVGGVGSLLDTFTQANKRYNDTWKSELKGNLIDNWNSIENNRLSANSNIWQQMENLSSETKAKLKGYGIDLTGAISNIHSDLAKDYFSGGNVNWNAADLKYINDLIAKIDLQRREKPEANYRWWINPPGENFTQSGGSVLHAMGSVNPEWQRNSSVGYDNRKALGE